MLENAAENGVFNAAGDAVQLALKEVVENVEFVADVLRQGIRVVVVATREAIADAPLVLALLVHGDDQGNDVVHQLAEVPLWLGLTHIVDAVLVLH